jgi:predicted nuclease of predicted toxin-antitoxin system
MKRILLDECIPRPLAQHLPDYYVRTAPQMGWASIANGTLLQLAEVEFDVFVTVDKGFRYEQSLHSTALGIIILRVKSNRLEDLLPLVPVVP